MASIYTHIENNKRSSAFVMAIFILFVSMIGYFFGQYYDIGGVFMFGLALFISGVSSYYSYYNSDKIVLKISKARLATVEEFPMLNNLIDNLIIASGIPRPKVYVIDDTAMNAFATGRDPMHSSIVFTTGILSGLNKRELEGVAAHEMSHIGNYDIRLMSLVTVLVGTITMLADLFWRTSFRGRRSSRREGGGVILLIGIVLLMLSPIIATLITTIQLGFSVFIKLYAVYFVVVYV